MVWERAPGVRVEPIGSGWVAFSRLSGDTLLISVESAAVLEVLADGPCEASALCEVLARDSATDAASIAPLLEDCRSALVAAGLVRIA
jgi:PqqD family protein of HPr-rel-A system